MYLAVLFLAFLVTGQVFAQEEKLAKEETLSDKEKVTAVPDEEVESEAEAEDIEETQESETPKAKEETVLFQGEVNSNGINIRADATVTSEIICNLDRAQKIDVISEVYDWYKIRLPKTGPSYIHKGLVALTEAGEEGKVSNTARVLKNNVNIRSRPDTSSPILGKAKQDDTVNILQDAGEWYKIEPVKQSYAWIHKNFVNKIEKKEAPKKAVKEETKEDEKDLTVVEGILRAKSITNIATHKIVSSSNILYLIKGDKEELDSFNRRKVKITGKITDPSRINPVIEVRKIEALD